MKKFFMMVALMLCISTATFAGGNDMMIEEINNIPTFSYSRKENVELNYNFDFNYVKLAEYLQLTEEDLLDVRNIHQGFCNGMKLAAEATTEESRNNLIFNSIEHELRLMKNILSDIQYRKFLRVFNTSLQNRGFSFFIENFSKRRNA